MLQNQNPAILAKVEMQRSKDEKEADLSKLMELREKERLEKIAKMKKYAGSRYFYSLMILWNNFVFITIEF